MTTWRRIRGSKRKRALDAVTPSSAATMHEPSDTSRSCRRPTLGDLCMEPIFVSGSSSTSNCPGWVDCNVKVATSFSLQWQD